MISLSAPQNVFLNQLNTKNTAYVGGFGAGKTFVGCLKLLIYISRFPRQRWGYWAPSYPSIRDVFYPTFEEAAELMGFGVKINTSNKEAHVYRGQVYYGTVICRSMSDPPSIVGYKVGGGICDEIDTMSMEKATHAWNKVNARLRLSIAGLDHNWLSVTTTPEGFKFVYDRFAKAPKSRYSMVQASTYENQRFLPPDYIENLLETYPANLIEAYLNGQFVNLTSGGVYIQFDRKTNASAETIQRGDTLHIGMDFNVGKMAAVIHVKRGDNPHAVDEILGAYDTPHMIKLIKERYEGNKVIVYPDSSGKNRKSNEASITDINQLQQAGFTVRYKSVNPRVRDRINAMNSMLCNASGERRYFVNPDKCPEYTQALEQQVYNKLGEPDKAHDQDHPNDAAGYFIAYEYPVIKPVSNVKFTSGA